MDSSSSQLKNLVLGTMENSLRCYYVLNMYLYSCLCSYSLSNHVCFVYFPCSLHYQNSLEWCEQPVTQEIWYIYIFPLRRYSKNFLALTTLYFQVFAFPFVLHLQPTHMCSILNLNTNLLKQTSPICIS